MKLTQFTKVSQLTCFILLLILSFIASTSAGCKKETNINSKSDKSANKLSILTLESIKSTGYLDHIIPAFEQTYNCKIAVTTCEDSNDLLETAVNDKESRRYDLILGIDNCFFTDKTVYEDFSVNTILKQQTFNSNYLFDIKSRIISYGYGYLSVLYNENNIPEPPETFGELQDARFLNQIVLCNPRKTGLGRATLYWTIALFGNEGYQQMWNSIKKNMYKAKDTWQDAMLALQMQECNMAFGFTSSPAWFAEKVTDPLPIKASVMNEGSFLYLEAAAIPVKAKHKELSEAFILHMLSPEMQRYVAFDLGLFPANESTPLPESFTSTYYNTFPVNDRLENENPVENINNWLDFWDRLFSHTIF